MNNEVSKKDIEDKVGSKQKQSLLRNIFNVMVKSILIICMFLILFIVIISYSSSVRHYFLNKITDVVNEFLIADVEISDIHIIKFNGIALQHVRVITAGDTLAYIPEIEININFEKIFLGIIDVNFIQLQAPRIKLLRSFQDSVWNYNKIINPSKNIEETTSPSKLKINIGELILNNAYFVMWDSTAEYKSAGHIHYDKLALKELNLYAKNISVNLENMNIEANIVNLAAYEIPSNFRIHKFSGKAKIDNNSIELKSTKIVLDNANFDFDARMSNFSIFGNGNRNIAKVDMFLELTGNDIDLIFIDNFVIIPVRLGFVKNIEILASGTLMDLNVQKLILNTNDSHIYLTECRLTNLLNTDSFSYKGILDCTNISRMDISDMLKNIDLSAVPNFKKVLINNTKFYGTKDSVYADLDFKTFIGNVKGNVGIGFGRQPFSYDINLDLRKINLSNILNNKKLSSNINANFYLKGYGINSGNIFANAKIELKRSDFLGFNFLESNILIDAIGDSLIIHDFSLKKLNIPNTNIQIDNSKFGGTEVIYRNLINNQELNYDSKISINGGINFKSFDMLHLILNIDLEHIELLDIIHKITDVEYKNLPTVIDSKIKLDITSFDIDNMIGNFDIDFQRLEFRNKNMLPLTISGAIDMQDTLNHKIELNIDNIFNNILYLSVNGKYYFTELLNDISTHFNGNYNFISNKINNFFEQIKTDTNTIIDNKNIKYITLNKNNANVIFQVRDIDWLNIFIPEFESNSSIIDVKFNFNSNYLYSNLNIDSIKIKNLNIKYKNFNAVIDNIIINGENNINILDSVANLENLYCVIKDGRGINISGSVLDSIELNANINKQQLNINFIGTYNNIIKSKLVGEINFKDTTNSEVIFDTLEINFNKQKWHNTDKIIAFLLPNSINIYNFNIERDNKEKLFLKGILKGDTIDNVSLTLNNFEFNDLQYILNLNNKNNFDIFAKLDTLKVLVNGTLNSPLIDLSLFVDDIRYINQELGYFNAYFRYNDENIHGHARMFSLTDKELLALIVKTIPIYIGLDRKKSIFKENSDIDLSVMLNKLPAQILSPFIPMVDNLKGIIDGNVNLGGSFPDKFTYDGNVTLENFTLRLLPTNIFYSVFGNIKIETDKIYFSNLKVRNSTTDLKNGEAFIDGMIKLDNFSLVSMDFSLSTKQFLLLNDQTATVMPWLYGKLIIATDGVPIRFYGDLKKPNLTGSILILNSELKMPQLLEGSIVKRDTKFKYINKDTLRLVIVSYTEPVDSNKQGINEDHNIVKANKDFMDLLNIDISAKIKRFSVLLDLGGIGQIFAKVGTTNPSEPIRYIKERDKAEAQILGGSLSVLDGSSVQIIRSMAAKGTIYFPTAKLSKPNFDLIAEYSGKMLNTNNSYDNFSVFAKITGTTTNPNLVLSYSINGVEAMGDKKQIEENAFILLTTGKLNGYVNESQNLVNEGASIVASQLASRTLTDLLIRTGVVQNANLQFESENINSATVKITGTLGEFANWTIGGNIADITSNYNISIDIPIVIKASGFNNLMLQLSKFSGLNTAAFDRDAKFWEIKLKLDGSW